MQSQVQKVGTCVHMHIALALESWERDTAHYVSCLAHYITNSAGAPDRHMTSVVKRHTVYAAVPEDHDSDKLMSTVCICGHPLSIIDGGRRTAHLAAILEGD